MALRTHVFDQLLASRRFAEARSESELQREWQRVQAEFQERWPDKSHKLIFIIHDRYSEISSDDVSDVLGQVGAVDKRQPIDIVLHTRGGGAAETDQIAAALVGRANTSAYVPIYANSGGTQIALATETIFMGGDAELGPIDLRYGPWSARDLVRIADELGEEAPADLQLVAHEAANALEGETDRVCKLINRRHKGGSAGEVVSWRNH